MSLFNNINWLPADCM